MKTAEQWNAEVIGHLTTKPVHPHYLEQGVIEKIQIEAFKAGLTLAIEIINDCGVSDPILDTIKAGIITSRDAELIEPPF